MARAAYNLDVYENLVFAVPPTDRLRAALLVGGTLYGLVVYGLARITLPFVGGPLVALGTVAAFVVPPLVTAGLTRRFPDFPRRWGYLLGLVAATLGFGFAVAELLVGPTDGWRLVGLGAAVVLLTLLAVLVLTAGTRQPVSLAAAGSPMALGLVGLPVAGARWFQLPAPDLPRAALSLAVVGVGLAASVYVHERLIDANVTYIDGSRLTSTLLTGREEDIQTGYRHEPLVQALRIDGGGGFTLVTPWVHPGPLVNFGGGAVAENVINRLNEDGAGFFAKGPVTHRDDAAETAITDRVLDALPDPAMTDRASRLIHRDYDGISFHGRWYGDRRVVFLEPDDFGDFPPSIVGDYLDPADTMVVDRHAFEPDGGKGLRYDSARARQLRAALDRFLDDLDGAARHDYRAGAAVDIDGKQVCALVEEVDGQRTVLFGANENEVSPTLLALESELRDEFDEAVVFSTDTHHDMHDLAARREVDPDRMRAVIDEAAGAVAPARAGVGTERAAETRLLGKEYYALQYTINYVLRSFTVSLAVLYALAAVIAAA